MDNILHCQNENRLSAKIEKRDSLLWRKNEINCIQAREKNLIFSFSTTFSYQREAQYTWLNVYFTCLKKILRLLNIFDYLYYFCHRKYCCLLYILRERESWIFSIEVFWYQMNRWISKHKKKLKAYNWLNKRNSLRIFFLPIWLIIFNFADDDCWRNDLVFVRDFCGWRTLNCFYF